MSATGRGAERRTNDFYETPALTVRRYLDARALVWPGDRWLEPSAGNGAIIRAVSAWCEAQCVDSPRWVALDIEPGPGIAKADFLSPDVSTANPFDLCIGNPPYKLAQEFIEKGLTVARKVAYLLRLNFLESGKRHAVFKSMLVMCSYCRTGPASTKTDTRTATAYGWFEFGEGASGKIHILNTTSKAERLADRVKAV